MGILRVVRNEGRTDAKVGVHGGADHRRPQGARGGDAGAGARPAAGGGGGGAVPLEGQVRRAGGGRGPRGGGPSAARPSATRAAAAETRSFGRSCARRPGRGGGSATDGCTSCLEGKAGG